MGLQTSKKLWNVRMTMVTTVVRVFRIVTNFGGVEILEELKSRERIKTLQTIVLLKSARIGRRVQEIRVDSLTLRFQWRTTCWYEKFSRSIIIIIITTTTTTNPGQKTRPYNNQQKKKRIRKIVDFTVPADHRINLKESEKKDKHLDFARGLKKLSNMKVTIVPIVIGTLGTVTKGSLKGLEDLEVGGWVETIYTTALLRTARILRRVLETWGITIS